MFPALATHLPVFLVARHQLDQALETFKPLRNLSPQVQQHLVVRESVSQALADELSATRNDPRT